MPPKQRYEFATKVSMRWRIFMLCLAAVLLFLKAPWEAENLVEASARMGLPIAYATLVLASERTALHRILSVTLVLLGFGAYFFGEYLRAAA